LNTIFKEPDSPDGYNGTMMIMDNATWLSEDNGDTVAGVTGFNGLTWLQTQPVDVVIDGVYQGIFTVEIGGVLTLPKTAERNVSFGNAGSTNVDVKTLPHASAGVGGPNWGRLKKFTKVYAYMVETIGGLVGDGEGTPEEIRFIEPETLVHGQTPLPKTDFVDLDYNWGSDVDPRVQITTNKPYPMTILSLGFELESNV